MHTHVRVACAHATDGEESRVGTRELWGCRRGLGPQGKIWVEVDPARGSGPPSSHLPRPLGSLIYVLRFLPLRGALLFFDLWPPCGQPCPLGQLAGLLFSAVLGRADSGGPSPQAVQSGCAARCGCILCAHSTFWNPVHRCAHSSLQRWLCRQAVVLQRCSCGSPWVVVLSGGPRETRRGSWCGARGTCLMRSWLGQRPSKPGPALGGIQSPSPDRGLSPARLAALSKPKVAESIPGRSSVRPGPLLVTSVQTGRCRFIGLLHADGVRLAALAPFWRPGFIWVQEGRGAGVLLALRALRESSRLGPRPWQENGELGLHKAEQQEELPGEEG